MHIINKVLIANRGEIALRIIRSIREMGIKTVAVFSEADRCAPHVRMADEAVCIGAPAVSKSYLNIEKIIHVARQAKADAIHPGYGFLSENHDFALEAEKRGLTFIGPSSKAIQLMGNKLAAKKAVASFDVPLIPGTMEPVTDISKAKKIAGDIGYPILLKASSGGGGKGMRIVDSAGELAQHMERATSEAQSNFGDGSVFIEKYITCPRHIEFQVLGDQQGNIVHLFERECSVQRRYQKVIEEAPSSLLTPELRHTMGETAIKVARSCGYYGAGTVEFIMDEKKNFYFLEMNTRLQVEHPVTEVITGLDLVRLQVEVAQGKTLPFLQKDLQINGHAIEARIYAEDPINNFLPDIGKLHQYAPPQGHGVRVDDGFEQGMEIPIHYDPMISKVTCHAASRKAAIDKMIRALGEYRIMGVKTTLDFCIFVMQHKAFRSGNFDTRFVEKHFSPDKLEKTGSKERQQHESIAAAIAVNLLEEAEHASLPPPSAGLMSNWKKNRL